jgi:hypothetical protein
VTEGSNRFSLRLHQSGWDRFARFVEYRDQLRGAAKPNLFVQAFSGPRRNFGPNGVTLQLNGHQVLSRDTAKFADNPTDHAIGNWFGRYVGMLRSNADDHRCRLFASHGVRFLQANGKRKEV